MISVQDVSKHYLEQVIFDNISFNLNPRERTALVGRNGHGKTTLFRMLTGQEQCDEGNIAVPKNYRIGYLSQHINFTKPTVLEEGCCSLPADQEGDDWRVKRFWRKGAAVCQPIRREMTGGLRVYFQALVSQKMILTVIHRNFPVVTKSD